MRASITLKRKLFFGSVFLLFFCLRLGLAQATHVNSLELPANDYKVTFAWLGDTVNTKWEPYSAMLIPVRLPGCPKQFYMQFDLGAPHSFFYKGMLQAVRKKYPRHVPAIDSSKKIAGFIFLIGKQKVAAAQIMVKDFGDITINWSNKSTPVIGTLGSDLIDNKTLIINYPAKQLAVSAAIPDELKQQLTLSPFMFIHGSVLLPAIIHSKQALLYFDTGSSAFELLTSKEVCTALAMPNTPTVSYPVKSWGKTLTANTVVTNDSLVLASQKLPISFATYIEGASDTQIQQMMKMGIGGMTGNKLFLNAILVLDTRNKKFGIWPEPAM